MFETAQLLYKCLFWVIRLAYIALSNHHRTTYYGILIQTDKARVFVCIKLSAAVNGGFFGCDWFYDQLVPIFGQLVGMLSVCDL